MIFILLSILLIFCVFFRISPNIHLFLDVFLNIRLPQSVVKKSEYITGSRPLNSCSESCFHKIHIYKPILTHFGLFWSIFGLFLHILGFFGRIYCIALNYAFICLMKSFRSVISIVFISFAAKSRKNIYFCRFS